MTRHSLGAIGAVTLAAAAAFSSAAAARGSDGPDYGSPVAHALYDHEICIAPRTQSVSVRRHEIVRFRNAEGREFLWRFDTYRPGVFPLARIAPAGVAVPSGVMVYVNPEIPIAP